jgi:hypothetical protein
MTNHPVPTSSLHVVEEGKYYCLLRLSIARTTPSCTTKQQCVILRLSLFFIPHGVAALSFLPDDDLSLVEDPVLLETTYDADLEDGDDDDTCDPEDIAALVEEEDSNNNDKENTTAKLRVDIIDGPYAHKTFELEPTPGQPCGLGRSKTFCKDGIRLRKDKEMSTSHGKFTFKNGQFHFVDVGSTNGTRVDGVELDPHAPFPLDSNGLLLTCGQSTLKIEIVFP